MARLISLLFTIVVLYTVPACYAEVIRIDPNTPGAQPTVSTEHEDILAQDKRLDRKVTFDAKRKRVVEILDALSLATGVTLKSGWNSKDWQVRDRKMVIYAQDIPLRDLMVSIARVMKFKWEVGGEGPDWTYRLYMDRAAVLKTEFDEQKRQERLQIQLAELRQKKADNLLRVADLTDAELDRIRESDPYSYAIGKLGLAGMLKAIPGAGGAIASGESSRVEYEDLPVQAQETVRRNTHKLLEFKAGLDHGKPVPANLDVLLQDAVIEVGKGICLYSSPTSHEELLNMELYDPASDGGQIIGKYMIELMEGRSIPGFNGRVMPTMAGSPQYYEKIEWGEPKAEHPEDQSLLTKVKLQLGERKVNEQIDYYDMLGIISKSTGYSIVSDALGGGYYQASYFGSEENKYEVLSMLEKLTGDYYCNWWKQGSIIEIRDRRWFEKRMHQLPEEWLENWRIAFRKDGTLDVGDLASLQKLTFEQWSMNISDDRVLRNLHMPQNEWMVSYLTSLDQLQWDRLFSSDGIDFDSFAPDQNELLRNIYSHSADSDDQGCRLFLSRERKDRQFVYKLAVKYWSNELNDYKLLIDRDLTTPEYKEPEVLSEDKITVRVSQ